MQRYVALVPVKPPALGKSRLVGLADDDASRLAAAFALDTVAACLCGAAIAEVLVATDDAAFSVELAALGAVTIPDGVAMDLNGTLRQSAAEARRRWPDLVPVALTGDLPALRAEDLDEALGAVAPGEAAYVADSDGLGTTLYTAAYDDVRPAVRPRLRAGPRRHRRQVDPAPLRPAAPRRRRPPRPRRGARTRRRPADSRTGRLPQGDGPSFAAGQRVFAAFFAGASSRPSWPVPSWPEPSSPGPSSPVPSWQEPSSRAPSWPVPSSPGPSSRPSWPGLLRGPAAFLAGAFLQEPSWPAPSSRGLLGRCLLGSGLLRRSLLGRRLLRRPSWQSSWSSSSSPGWQRRRPARRPERRPRA